MFKFLEEKGCIVIQGGVTISFRELYRTFNRPNEHIYLLKKTPIKHHNHVELDEFGFAKTTYDDISIDGKEVCEIKGIIQQPQVIDINEKGVESNPNYILYCFPTIHLKIPEINEYRIKYVKPYETCILKIIEYNPNLFLGGKHKSTHHHVKMKLLLEKKI